MNYEPEHPQPTLEDVAREAGVSTATVSRCLNMSATVSPEAKKKVMIAVNALGYTPNFSARALAAKRTFTIGAIIPTMENAIFARGLQAFQETLHEKGYTLLVSSTAYQPDVEAEQIRNLAARGADGLLLIGYERDPETYAFLASRQIPYLLAWSHRENEPYPSVGFDNRRSMSDLTKVVLEKGHRKIAIISGVKSGNDRVTDRVAGIREALKNAGIEPETVPLIETTYSVDNGGEAFQRLMTAETKPSAIICINDVLAVGAMQRAREMGLNVPEDVSITGFDDIEVASLVTPQLTTVHVPHRHMGRTAAIELINMVEKKSAGVSSRLDSSLRIRGTLSNPS